MAKKVLMKDLRYGTIRKLAQSLNDAGGLHWKDLAAQFDFYKDSDIADFEHCRDRLPSESLVRNLGQRMITVDECYEKLRRMGVQGHRQAMEILQDNVSPNLLEEDLRNVVQPVQENGTGRRDLDPPAVGSASTTHGPMPPAPPTQSTKLRRSEADLSVSAMNLSWVTKETKQFTRNLLGEGRLGNSYRAMPPGGGNLVVVKVLRSGANNDPNMIRRLCECKQLNLAKVIGYLLGPHRKVLIISECVQGPSLHSILKQLHLEPAVNASDSLLSWQQRLFVSMGVAEGLSYLHSRKPPLCHGNLKSTNIIIEKPRLPKPVPKLTDYSLAVENVTRSELRGLSGGVTASCQETLSCTDTQCQQISPLGDVYSYGLILLQLLTGELSYNETKKPPHLVGRLEVLLEEEEPQKQSIERISCPKARWPPDTACNIFGLVQTVLMNDLRDRPSMQEMIEQLESVMTQQGLLEASQDVSN